ncbi:MAG: S8 family serine peptidase [Actinomycetales bacterium]|nr:S8 family serine peptidase [Candidatus Phosphoribacter baldrii]
MIRRGTWLTAGISLLAALLAAPPSALAAPGDLTAVQARASQWWLDGLGVSKAHQVTRGEGVTVCEIDSIFDTSHPDLVGADVSMGADLTHARLSDFVGDPQKDHGTAMTALIVGQGSGPDRKEGTLGTAPKARVVFVQVDLSKAPAARDGIKECADLGADVINVSLAGLGEPEAVAYAQARDAVVVAGTGNGGSSQEISDLAGLWGVLSVTGVDASLQRDPRANTAPARFPFSDLKPEPKNEDRGGAAVAGPYSRVASTSETCKDIITPKVGGGYRGACGTSDATAIVAGIVALVRSAHPELNAANVVNRIVRTTKPSGAASLPSVPLGFGVVDALAAVTAQVPLVDHNPLGSCYTGGRGVWDERVKPSRPEPPVNTRLAPAPWKDPIPDVPVAAPAVSSAAPSTAGGSVVASGPVSGGGVPWLVWVGGVLVLVLGVGVGVRVAGKGR